MNKESTKDLHSLLDFIQLSCRQASTADITVKLDGKVTMLRINRSYCSGVKECGGEGCAYTVSTKQRVNRCTEHEKMASGPQLPFGEHIIIPIRLNSVGYKH